MLQYYLIVYTAKVLFFFDICKFLINKIAFFCNFCENYLII